MCNKLLLAAVAVAALSCAGQSAAQDRWSGWGADIFVGTSTETSSSDDGYFPNVEPAGTIYGLGGSYRRRMAGDLVVGVEASVAIGSVEDSFTETTTFDEDVTYTVNTSYSGRFGFLVGHEFGPVLVSVLAGVEIRNRSIYTEVDSSDPDSKDYFYDQTWAAFGPYFGLRAEYALTDRTSIGAQWTRSEVIQSSIKFSDGDTYEDSAEYNEAQIRMRVRF